MFIQREKTETNLETEVQLSVRAEPKVRPLTLQNQKHQQNPLSLSLLHMRNMH